MYAEVKFHNPADELHNLLCDNGGRVIEQVRYNDYWIENDVLRAKAARDVTYEIPINWTFGIHFPREAVSKKLRKYFDFASPCQLKILVPTKNGLYGVFLVTRRKPLSTWYEVRSADRLFKKKDRKALLTSQRLCQSAIDAGMYV